MRSLVSLVRKDLKGYFDQPTGYILLVIFVGVASYLFFFQAPLSSQEASVRPLFESIMPWMLAVFVAAATMRLVAEEQRDGTLEILLTQPIRGWTVLIAKFLSGLIFVGVGILFTIGAPLALATAGDLDIGAVIAQYVGTFFLTASFVAIGLFSSSLTRNQIVAFIVSLTVILILLFGGLTFVSVALPSRLAVLVQDLSPVTHFSIMARGVIDLRDILYFVALVSAFLFGMYLMIRGKSVSHRSPLYRNLQLGVGGLVIMSLLVGWFGRSIEGRWDLTEQKLFTLSPATEELLADLDDVVTIKLFESRDPPVQIAPTTRDVRDFVDDLAAKSDGKVRVVKIFADESEETELEAEQSFVPPVPFNIETQGELGIKVGYLGMGFTYANQQEPIPFVDSLDGLEYRVASTIYRVTQKEQRNVAVLFGHGEKRRDAMLQSFRNWLERNHAVTEISDRQGGGLGPLHGQFVDVLVIAGPTEFMDEIVKDDIDTYLANGGKALILIDPVNVDPRRGTAEPNEFSMADYLEQYGVKARRNVVFDLESNETVTFQGRFGPVSLPFPYWVSVPTVENQISGGGGASVVFPWSSSLELIEPTNKTVDREVTPLLETSENAGLDYDYRDITPQSARLEGVSEDELGRRLLAVALTGTRCQPGLVTCDKDLDRPFRLIIAAESDWISESMVNQYPQHLALGSNWIDWLMQEDALATIRSKGTSRRPLTFGNDVISANAHVNLVRYSNVVGVPAIFILLGLVRYFMRRNTTRKVYTRDR